MKNNSQNLKRKRKVDTSKLILIVILSYIILLTPIGVWVAIATNNPSPIDDLIIGAFSLATVAVGFYYWKAKAENLHKYKQDSNITMGD